MKILFCFPVHNEAEILEDSIVNFLEFMKTYKTEHDWRVLVAINNSSDTTLFIAESLMTKYPEVMNISNTSQPGKGNAIKTCFQKADDDILVYMDIDLAVSLDDIPELINTISASNYDLAFGSRLLPQSNTKRSRIRSLSSKTYNLLSRIILHHDFSDLQCGFKAIKKEAFRKIESFILDDEWFFDTELIFFAKHYDLKIKELPVTWEENRYDQRKSKVSVFKVGIMFIKKLFRLRRRLKTEKLKDPKI